MSSEIGVKLVGDSSSFRSMLDQSVQDGVKFAGDIASKTGQKLVGMQDLSRTIAAAFGLNLEKIAQGIARIFTGMSEEEEAGFKALESLSAKATDLAIKNMRSVLTEEKRYALALQDRDRLQKVIDAGASASGAAQAKLAEAKIKLEEKVSEILEYQAKQREVQAKKDEEYLKRSDDALKNHIAAGEKEYQVRLKTHTIEERIAILKDDILLKEQLIGQLGEKDSTLEQQKIILAERRNLLITEEAKLRGDIASAEEKNADAAAKAAEAEAEVGREQLTLLERRKAIQAEINELAGKIAYGEVQQLDVSKEIARVEKLRGELREIEKAQAAANLEIAKLLLKGAESLTAEERLRLDILRGQVKQKELDAEISRLTAGALAGQLTPAERERLAVLVGQSAELKTQLAQMAGINTEVGKMITAIGRSGSGYAQQSDAALAGVQARLRDQLSRARSANAAAPGGPGEIFQSGLSLELSNVTREIDVRHRVADYASRFGEVATRREFGDTLTDRGLRSMTDTQEKSLLALNELNERLEASGLFPRR